jgi:hypothetical protein
LLALTACDVTLIPCIKGFFEPFQIDDCVMPRNAL